MHIDELAADYDKVKQVYDTTLLHLEINGFNRVDSIAGLLVLVAAQVTAVSHSGQENVDFVLAATNWIVEYFGFTEMETGKVVH